MKIFLKVFIAALIAGLWYHISEGESGTISLVIFAFVLLILLLRPIEFQSPQKREDYLRQIKKKREHRLALEAKQKEEQLRLYKANHEREEKKKRNLEEKLRNR